MRFNIEKLIAENKEHETIRNYYVSTFNKCANIIAKKLSEREEHLSSERAHYLAEVYLNTQVESFLLDMCIGVETDEIVTRILDLNDALFE